VGALSFSSVCGFTNETLCVKRVSLHKDFPAERPLEKKIFRENVKEKE